MTPQKNGGRGDPTAATALTPGGGNPASRPHETKPAEEPMMSKQFWMVKGAGPANAVHFSREDAEREADRLARQNPGRQFFVLEAVSLHRKVDVERIALRGETDADEQIPF